MSGTCVRAGRAGPREGSKRERADHRKFQGDTAKFRQALADRADEFVKIADRARSAGAIHHRFGVGDGFVVIVDEWESTGHFERFFADPSLQEFIGSAGPSRAAGTDHH